MKFIRSTITIISELIILVLAILWYIKTHEYEPLIAIIVSTVGLITSSISKFVIRPKIELQHKKTDWGRNTRGYTANNPPIIRVGIDHPNQYWELFWNFVLEIRNNSSLNAYSIEIEYLNIPEKTIIHGNFGKIEPLLANEKREFRIKVVQNITGTHIDADKYLKDKILEIMGNTQILVKYKDESGITFYTEYNWSENSNKLKLLK